MRPLRDQSAIEEQALIFERKPAPQTIRSHPDEVEEIRGELIFTGALVGDRKMIFFPYPIEERDHPVIKDVEKTPERSVLVARAIHHQFSVLMRKNSEGSDRAHKRNHHLRRRALLLRILSQVVNLARRKRERRSRAKAHDFARGVSVLAHWSAVSMNALKQAHGLKERKPIRLVQKFLR